VGGAGVCGLNVSAWVHAAGVRVLWGWELYAVRKLLDRLRDWPKRTRFHVLLWNDLFFGNATFDEHRASNVFARKSIFIQRKLHQDNGIVCVFID